MTTLKLSDQELQALVGLIDAGVRATGIRGVRDAANLLAKIEKAAEEANATKNGTNVETATE